MLRRLSGRTHEVFTGICLIDATHYATEIIIVQSLLDMLTKKGLRCAASQVDGQPFHVL